MSRPETALTSQIWRVRAKVVLSCFSEFGGVGDKFRDKVSPSYDARCRNISVCRMRLASTHSWRSFRTSAEYQPTRLLTKARSAFRTFSATSSGPGESGRSRQVDHSRLFHRLAVAPALRRKQSALAPVFLRGLTPPVGIRVPSCSSSTASSAFRPRDLCPDRAPDLSLKDSSREALVLRRPNVLLSEPDSDDVVSIAPSAKLRGSTTPTQYDSGCCSCAALLTQAFPGGAMASRTGCERPSPRNSTSTAKQWRDGWLSAVTDFQTFEVLSSSCREWTIRTASRSVVCAIFEKLNSTGVGPVGLRPAHRAFTGTASGCTICGQRPSSRIRFCAPGRKARPTRNVRRSVPNAGAASSLIRSRAS